MSLTAYEKGFWKYVCREGLYAPSIKLVDHKIHACFLVENDKWSVGAYEISERFIDDGEAYYKITGFFRIGEVFNGLPTTHHRGRAMREYNDYRSTSACYYPNKLRRDESERKAEDLRLLTARIRKADDLKSKVWSIICKEIQSGEKLTCRNLFTLLLSMRETLVECKTSKEIVTLARGMISYLMYLQIEFLLLEIKRHDNRPNHRRQESRRQTSRLLSRRRAGRPYA